MSVIPHGIDVDWWRDRSHDDEGILRKHGLIGARYVLGIGRQVPNKNFRSLIGAIARLPSDVKLVLAGGEGTETEMLLSIIAANGLTDRVIMTGFISRDELRTLMHHAAVFAFPSLNEGFGIPVLEAFAAGVPVVCSDVPSLKEVAGDAAIMVDFNTLGGAIETILNDVAVRASLIERGKARADRFNWDVAALEYLNVFQRTIDNAVYR
jgi:alpha-1,3-rhamnosyl/mannosyltransferase